MLDRSREALLLRLEQLNLVCGYVLDIKKPYALHKGVIDRVRSPIYRVGRGMSGNDSSGQNYPRGLTDDSTTFFCVFI